MPADILRIAIPSPLYRDFDYLTPAGNNGQILQPGIRVRVPFGRTQHIGILQEQREDSPLPRAKLRRALEIIDTAPVLPEAILRLIRWAQTYYHHPPGEVYMSALPALLRQGKAARQSLDPLWRITPSGRVAMDTLQRAPRQLELLSTLAAHPDGLNGAELRSRLPGWTATRRPLRQKGWIECIDATSASQQSQPSPRSQAARPELNQHQAAAVAAVSAALGSFQSFLLAGVTGSGKTEVYLRLTEYAWQQGLQTLLLVPEIGLTPQLLTRFKNRIDGPLAILHSGLSDRERLDAWLQARDGNAATVIGTRSAIFTPLLRPGLIIIDEEHDLSFKQQEGFRYNARDLAVIRARQSGIPVLLGSATPSLESLHNVNRQRYCCLPLPQRVGAAVEPKIELLDLRRQPLTAHLAKPLLQAMQAHLDDGNQVLLFLNRRGYAPALICHECGWLSQCQNCDARMTLHLRRQRLICHHCDHEQALPRGCPVCGSVDLRALGQGTERLESVLHETFSDAGIARIDRDSTRRKGSLEAMLDDIHSGRRRLLIGTQMLAKGHHFPNVTLVGIVDADQGLFGVDYRASERMAQQILQVAGRAGRADKPGIVIIQTHHPEHPLLQTLLQQDYAAFATAALAERAAADLPPYTCQALLRADATTALPTHQFLTQAAALQPELSQDLEILGPIPAPMERRAGRYRAQLLLQTRHRSTLHRFLNPWIRQVSELKSARKVRWSLDVDPLDLY